MPVEAERPLMMFAYAVAIREVAEDIFPFD
jgi:hypothetical protein